MKKIGQHGFKPTEQNTCVGVAIVNYASTYSDPNHMVDKEMLFQRYLNSPLTSKNNGTEIRLLPAQVEYVTKGVYSAVLLVHDSVNFNYDEKNILAQLRDPYNESAHQALRDFKEWKMLKHSKKDLESFIERPYSIEDRAYIILIKDMLVITEDRILIFNKDVSNNFLVVAHAMCVDRAPPGGGGQYIFKTMIVTTN